MVNDNTTTTNNNTGTN